MLDLGDRLSARTACKQPLQVAAALTVKLLQAAAAAAGSGM
jgi:hypothetical protein